MEPSGLFARSPPTILASAPVDSVSPPSLTANLICRVTLALISNLVCLVPLRILYRNGELAAAVFIINVEIRNLFIVVFSLIWRDNDMQNWWPGYGLCDVYPFIFNVNLGLYSTCLLAIMRNLAHQVGLLRANPLTTREKRRRNMIQALIMFPLPIVQLALTWPLTMQRYAVGAVAGCIWVAFPAWPYLVFFILAPVVVALLTAVYAAVIYFRFRQVTQNTRSVLSGDRDALMRAQHTRRRLYLMVISILTPFLPAVFTLAVINILDMGSIQPFNYKTIHHHTSPYPWNTILFMSSKDLGFGFLNIAYVPIFSGILIFIFFGLTQEAVNDYRRILLAAGVGKISPWLHREYDPNNSSRAYTSAGSSRILSSDSRADTLSRSAPTSTASATISSIMGDNSKSPQLQPISFFNPTDLEEDLVSRSRAPQWPRQPFPSPATAAHAPSRLPNSFLFRTRFELPHIPRFPSYKSRRRAATMDATPIMPLRPLHRLGAGHWDHGSSQVRTRVWSEDEIALCGDELPGSRSNPAHSSQGVVVETALTRETHQVRSG